jgi:hypothetical protein
MRIVRVIMMCTALLATSAVTAGSAAGDPAIQVVPATGLAAGDTVSVAATGVTPLAAVRAIQCDVFTGSPDTDCYDRATTAADSVGGVMVNVTLADPVYRAHEFGDPTPVYCRADACRIFLVWDDESGVQQVLTSDALEFTGSPATIGATPGTDLHKRQRVLASGTVYGAEGRTARILEEACFAIVQGSGCYGEMPAVTTTVSSDGSYSAHYRVRRFLADGTDCAGDILGACELTVVVLDANENPDDSFGVSRIGQPAAWLTFRTR